MRASCPSPSPWAASLHTRAARAKLQRRIHLKLNFRFRYVEASGWCEGVFAGIFSSRHVGRSANPEVPRWRLAWSRSGKRARDARAGGGVAKALGTDGYEGRAGVEQVASVTGAASAGASGANASWNGRHRVAGPAVLLPRQRSRPGAPRQGARHVSDGSFSTVLAELASRPTSAFPRKEALEGSQRLAFRPGKSGGIRWSNGPWFVTPRARRNGRI